MFLGAPKAHAASWVGQDLAKTVLADVAPASSNASITPDQSSSDSAFIAKPFVADTVITPPDPPRQVLSASYYRVAPDYSLVTGPHYFPYGYCTYYVSQKRTITWTGNAGVWLGAAKAQGLTTGDDPKPGAILVTSEGGRTGHVAYVESVHGDQFTVSEMNYKGYGIVSTRTLTTSYGSIKGFIY